MVSDFSNKALASIQTLALTEQGQVELDPADMLCQLLAHLDGKLVLPPEGFKFKLDTVIAHVCVCACQRTHRDSRGLRQLGTAWKYFFGPEEFYPFPYLHTPQQIHTFTHAHTAQTHQVFKERGELLGEDGELEES